MVIDYESAIKKYKENYGAHCVYCCSFNIEQTSANWALTRLYIDNKCNDCGWGWTDIYVLTDVCLSEDYGKEKTDFNNDDD